MENLNSIKYTVNRYGNIFKKVIYIFKLKELYKNP